MRDDPTRGGEPLPSDAASNGRGPLEHAPLEHAALEPVLMEPVRSEQDLMERDARGFPGELMIWLSASFPVGGFAYSQGLETAADKGWVDNARSLEGWLLGLLRHGALHNDLVLIALILRAGTVAERQDLVALAGALQPSLERCREAEVQGQSFMLAYHAAWPGRPLATDAGGAGWRSGDPDHEGAHDSDMEAHRKDHRVTLPAALAMAAREHRIAPAATLEAYAIAFCNNLLSAAIRLGLIGQFDGQRIIAALLGPIRAEVAAAACATTADLGTATFGADLAAIQHETQKTRLFRS